MAKLEPKRWGEAALGGLLLALGGLLFAARPVGKTESAKAAATERREKRSGKAGRMRPSGAPGTPGGSSRAGTRETERRHGPRAAEVPIRTRHWPPPNPEPVASEGGASAPERPDLPVGPESRRLGYEVADTRAGTIAKAMVFGLGVIAVSIAGLFWFIAAAHRTDALSPPLTQQQLAVIVPPAPRLQDHPLHDIAMERKREEDLLTSYGWTDPSHRAARIPIARAEALVIGRPLDPPPAAAPAPLP